MGDIFDLVSHHFREVLLTILLNLIHYCHESLNTDKCSFFVQFPCVPNLFNDNYSLTKESIMDEVKRCKDETDPLYKVYSDFVCENDVFKLFRSPDYRYRRYECKRKALLFVENLIVNQTNISGLLFESRQKNNLVPYKRSKKI